MAQTTSSALTETGTQALTTTRDVTRIPGSGNAISTLYYRITSQRVQDRSVVLQFVSSKPGEGTSLVARQFVAFAAQAEGGSALLVDCGRTPPPRPLPGGPAVRPSIMGAFQTEGRINAAMTEVQGRPGLHVARLDDGIKPNNATMAGLLDQMRDRYQFTALDTPSLEESAATLTFSRACDGVILILEAENTSGSVAEATVEALERAGAKVLGLVFNKRRRHVPRWLAKHL